MENNENVKETKKKNKKKRKIKKTTILFIVLDLFALTGFFLTYGPIDYFRNLLVNTAMNTMSHKHLAYIFYSEDMVNDVLNKNFFVEVNEEVNLDEIVIDTSEKDYYENEYEEAILKRDNPDDLYKVINIKVGSANAYLVAIYDPTKVRTISTKSFGGQYGERIITMCERYGGEVCINSGGMVDDGVGSGIPIGYVIEDGEITWSDGDVNTTRGNIIGITAEGKLTLMRDATGKEALDAGVMHGVEFGPFLIVNGKSMQISGDPWGKAARVVIAQRKDGVMLFLVTDGENYIGGGSLQDVVTTLELYGAYNAANLDGGHSATLIVDNKLYNNPPEMAKNQNGRYVVTGFGLVP